MWRNAREISWCAEIFKGWFWRRKGTSKDTWMIYSNRFPCRVILGAKFTIICFKFCWNFVRQNWSIYFARCGIQQVGDVPGIIVITRSRPL